MTSVRPRRPTGVHRPVADGLIFYSCRALGKLTQASLDNLTAPRAWRNVLHHAAKRWLSPPQRRHNRKRGSYRIEVCPRLSSLWSLCCTATFPAMPRCRQSMNGR